MRILLIAKPWRGGLAPYIYQALQDLFPGAVEWWPTRPLRVGEKFIFGRDREAWYSKLKKRLAGVSADAILFINHLPIFEELPCRSQQVLWLTDGPRPQRGEYSCYGKICLSDSGYAPAVAAVVGDRFGGEVPFGFSPTLHSPRMGFRRSRDLCFIGNRDPKRDRYLEVLLKAGVRVTIIGNYFLHHDIFWRYPWCFRPAVANEAMGRVYARHRLSINLHAQVVRQGTNMRTFECAGYGIPQLVENLPGLEKVFEPDREIATFAEEGEMLAVLDRLLNDPAGAEAMARRARRRAFREHSYHQRCIDLLAGILPSKLMRERIAVLRKRGGPLEVPS